MEFTIEMIVASTIFVLTYLLIVLEKVDRVIVALGGGIVMVLSQAVMGLAEHLNLIEDAKGFGLSQEEAFLAIDLKTIGLLISMMVIVLITQKTGVFEYLSIKMVKLAKGEPWKILVLLSLITGVCSAFLDNVTTILLVLPITLDVCRELKIKPVPIIISQIFASNIGGTATLIGDPPNIMIGSKVGLSFLDFIVNVAPIILVILPITIFMFVSLYGKILKTDPVLKAKVMQMNEQNATKDKVLLVKSLSVLFPTIMGFVLHGFLHIESSTIAITGAVLLLLLSKVSIEKVLSQVEWKTIFFFSGLFMLVGGLEASHTLKWIAQQIVVIAGDDPLLLAMMILWVSAIASAFVDNIPFTATMIPLIKNIGTMIPGVALAPLWWALSLGACLGGNGTIIGASANVVASGLSEEAGYKIRFGEYFKVCFPIMLVTVAISSLYIWLRYYI